jgi:hypothetical protein
MGSLPTRPPAGFHALLTLEEAFDCERRGRLSSLAMQLLDTAQPPSPGSKAAEKAKVAAPKIAATLPSGRERFIPVSRQ